MKRIIKSPEKMFLLSVLTGISIVIVVTILN